MNHKILKKIRPELEVKLEKRLNRPAKQEEIKNAETDQLLLIEVLMDRLDTVENYVANLMKNGKI